jgi:release factor glutamine methyltransferase
MQDIEEIYEPQEDSFMLAEAIDSYAFGSVLDIGTGSGILAEHAAGNSKVKSVLAVDINPDAVEHCIQNIRNKKIKFLHSNLFSNVKGKFDFIVFNPPYLPEGRDRVKDKALIGGRKGHEILEKFFREAGKHLNPHGRILIVFSSLTGKEKVDSIIKKCKFKAKLLEKRHIFFEDLYIYLIER